MNHRDKCKHLLTEGHSHVRNLNYIFFLFLNVFIFKRGSACYHEMKRERTSNNSQCTWKLTFRYFPRSPKTEARELRELALFFLTTKGSELYSIKQRPHRAAGIPLGGRVSGRVTGHSAASVSNTRRVSSVRVGFSAVSGCWAKAGEFTYKVCGYDNI